MANKFSRYDPELQMFGQEGSEPNMDKLRFLRWLAERGALEHSVFGKPEGIYASLVKPEGAATGVVGVVPEGSSGNPERR